MSKKSKSYLENIPRILNALNIEKGIVDYLEMLKEMKFPVDENNVYNLIRTLKRDELKTGPYKGISVFEASNRIMTDLTILYGIKFLLQDPRFSQFTEYTVEFGNENNKSHDISSYNGVLQLHGEAFNVAPSFFHIKKNSSIKKLRLSKKGNDFLLILYNSDARTSQKPIETINNEYFVSVDIKL